MKIEHLYKRADPVFSFEFFPPKTDQGAQNLMSTVADLKASVEPDYVSVTYGAGGSTSERTLGVVARIQSELATTTMAHQTCVAATPEAVVDNVERLTAAGVHNVLALRGDLPQDHPEEAVAGGLTHATDLISLLAQRFDLSIGAACYPEVHPEATSPEDDLRWTRAKQDLGVGFLITQLFFDTGVYFDHVERARAAGIRVPIIPGIMPITNVAQIERFTKMCGARIPDELYSRMCAVKDDPGAVMATGVEHAITQCRELLDRGAPGLHFYTLNKSHATRSVLAAIRRLT